MEHCIHKIYDRIKLSNRHSFSMTLYFFFIIFLIETYLKNIDSQTEIAEYLYNNIIKFICNHFEANHLDCRKVIFIGIFNRL